MPVLSCFPLPPEERRSTEVRSIACDDVPVCVASLLFVCFNSIGSSQVLEVFVLFDGKGLNQKFTAPIPLPNFLFSSTPIDSFTRLGMNVLKEHNLLSLSFEKYPIYVHPPWSFSNDFNVFKPEMHVRKKKDKKKNKKACEAVLNEIRKDYEPVLEVYTIIIIVFLSIDSVD